MQNTVLHNFHRYFDTQNPFFEELDPNFEFEILAKKDGIGTIPQPCPAQDLENLVAIQVGIHLIATLQSATERGVALTRKTTLRQGCGIVPIPSFLAKISKSKFGSSSSKK